MDQPPELRLTLDGGLGERIIGNEALHEAPTQRKLKLKNACQDASNAITGAHHHVVEKQPHSTTTSKFFSSVQSKEEYQELMSLDDERWDAKMAKLGEQMDSDFSEDMLWYLEWLRMNPNYYGNDTPGEMDNGPTGSESGDSNTSSTLTHPSDKSDSTFNSRTPGSSTSTNRTFQCSLHGCTDTVALEFDAVKKHYRDSLHHYGVKEGKVRDTKSQACPIGNCDWVKKGTTSDRNRLAEHICGYNHFNVAKPCPLCNVKQKSARLSSFKRHRDGEAGRPGACKVCVGCRKVFKNGRKRTQHEAICLATR